MDGYKDFTVNTEAFPDFKGFVDEMKEDYIHLVPIIDAGVKIEEGYDAYEERPCPVIISVKRRWF